LRFIDADGQTVLPHEIDNWNAAGDSFVWVRVPTINATNTDHIWLYYGNSNAADAQDAAKLWNGFVGVYHLSPSSGMPTQFADSAGSSPGAWSTDMAGTIIPGTIVPGQINQAVGLDGTAYVHIGDNGNVAADPGESRTVEAWVNTSQSLEQYVVYEEGQCVGWTLGMNANGKYRGTFITDPILPLCGPGTYEYPVTTTAAPSVWHYLTLVVDRPGLVMRLYVDGALMDSIAIDNTEVADGNGVFRIGSDYDGGAGTFVGVIDEVRVSATWRPAAWIAAQYKSMTDTFLTFDTL
jgi:hypothetical protein